MNYFFQAFKKIFTYQGRARRAEYGWFLLINFLLQFGVGLTALVLLGGGKMLFATNTSEIFIHSIGMTALLLYVILFIYSLLNFFVMLSLTARRLHDLGWSGWWQLAVYFSPLLAGVVFVLLPIIEASPLNPVWVVKGSLSLIGIGIVIFYLMLLFKDGQKHPNKYGESPKYPTQTA
ncbi:MAG: DUF805 domain-containing protein [Pasteurellaceae bacterium]|nr:DUF805 domain-containing protein [Pasteurellaceae bacterium]